MKNNYIYLLLIIFTIQSIQPATINQIAETKEHYPRFIFKLRAKAQDFLRNKEINMAVTLQELLSKGLRNKANYYADAHFYVLNAMTYEFDKEFERLDKKYDVIGSRLDEENAPDKIKAQFIQALKADAQASINAMIERYKD